MFTKGEWEVYTGHDNFFMDEPYILAPMDLSKPGISRPDKCVAIVKFITKEQTKANAHLIAAAPKMYEALKGYIDIIELTESSMNKYHYRVFKQALAKAESK